MSNPHKIALERLLDQLQYAVERHKGKTTITQSNLRVLYNALSQLPDK